MDKAISKVTSTKTTVDDETEEFTGEDQDIGAEIEVVTDNRILPTNVTEDEQLGPIRRNTRSKQMQNLKEASVVIEKLPTKQISKEEREEKELEERMSVLMWGKNASAVNTSKKKIARLKDIISILERDRDEKEELRKKKQEQRELNRKLKELLEEKTKQERIDRDLRNLRKFNDDGTLRTRSDEIEFRNKERALQKEKEDLENKIKLRREKDDFKTREDNLRKQSLALEEQLQEIKRKQEMLQDDADKLASEKKKKEEAAAKKQKEKDDAAEALRKKNEEEEAMKLQQEKDREEEALRKKKEDEEAERIRKENEDIAKEAESIRLKLKEEEERKKKEDEEEAARILKENEEKENEEEALRLKLKEEEERKKKEEEEQEAARIRKEEEERKKKEEDEQEATRIRKEEEERKKKEEDEQEAARIRKEEEERKKKEEDEQEAARIRKEEEERKKKEEDEQEAARIRKENEHKEKDGGNGKNEEEGERNENEDAIRKKRILDEETISTADCLLSLQKGKKIVKFANETTVHYLSDSDTDVSNDTVLITDDEIRKNEETSIQENRDETKPLLSDLVTPIVDVDLSIDLNEYYSQYDDDFPIPLSQNKTGVDIDSGCLSGVDEQQNTDLVTYVTEDGDELRER